MPDNPHPSGLTRGALWLSYHRYPWLLAKIATFVVVIGAVYLAFSAVDAVLVPVLTALLIAYLLDPVVDHFEARGWSRSNTIVLLLGAGLTAVGLFLLFLYPIVAHQVSVVAKGVPTLIERVETDLLPWVETTFDVAVPATWADAISSYGATVQSQIPAITKTAGTAFGEVLSGITGIVASAVNLVMIPVFTFYFLRDFDLMRHAVVDYLPTQNRELILDRLQKMDEVVGAWFRGQVEVALILAVLYSIGLAVVFGWTGIGVGAGIGVGMLSGLLNIIPYFGFAIGFVTSILMVLLDWHGVGPLIAVVAVFAVVQSLEGYVITPRVVGEKVGLSPVTVIISLLLGGELLGLAGILLALPIAGILRVLWPDIVGVYKTSAFYTGDTGPPDQPVAALIVPEAPPTDKAEATSQV